MAENASKRMSQGEASKVSEKAQAPRRKPRTIAEQVADIQAKGRHQLEKLNTRYAKELAAVAVTMRKINEQRVALGQEAHFTGELRFELTETGAYVTQVPAATQVPADTNTDGDTEDQTPSLVGKD